MIRVLLVEDEALVRQGIRALLEMEEEISIVGEAPDGEAALEAIHRYGPDVVLLDVRMPRRGGLEVLEELANRGIEVACLVLTTFDDHEVLLEAIRLGASGYLRKDVSLGELLRAIRALARGESYFQPSLTENLLRGLRRLAPAAPDAVVLDPLTPRETEVLRLLAGGCSNREIAHALGMAEGTVKVHVSSILSKLGVRDRIQAVLKALDGGLLTADGEDGAVT